MQNILWIGEPYFAPELGECGFEHVHVLPAGDTVYCWNDLVRFAGFTPDVVVVADSGGAPFVLGMEEFPCFTIFYSVYSHIHAWHRLYAQGFDACMVAQGGNAGHFAAPFLHPAMIWHMPPFAPSQAWPEAEREWDVLYISNPSVTGSLAFGEKLARLVSGLVAQPGAPEQMYPKAKIIIQDAGEHPGLDFRLFEAIGAGACLVLPRVGHGLDHLFVDGEHMVLYKPHDAGDAAYHIKFLLEHPELIEYIAQKGKALVDESHRASHRAWAFTDHIFELASYDISDIIAKRRANAPAIRQRSLAVPYVLCSRQTPGWKRAAFMAAARGKFGLEGISG